MDRMQLAQSFEFANKTLGQTYEKMIESYNAEHGTNYSVGFISRLISDLNKHRLENKVIDFPGTNVSITLKRYDIPKHLYMTDDMVLFVSGDGHRPFLNYPFNRAKLQLMMYYKSIGKTVWSLHAGDMNDNKKLSPHGHANGENINWDLEHQASRESLKQETNLADNTIFMLGNHDYWFMRVAHGGLSEDDYYDYMLSGINRDKVQCIKKTFCAVHDSIGEKWHVTHSISYSRNAGTNSRKIAEKRRCHVITQHEHHLARGRDDYNFQNWIANGMEADDVMMEYANVYDSNKPIMKSSFVVLERGQAKLFAPYPGYERWQNYNIDPSEMFDYEAQKRKVRTNELDIERFIDMRYEQESRIAA